MKTIQEIINNHGYITEDQIADLEKNNPNLFVVIKFVCSPRQRVKIKDFRKTVEWVKKSSQYEYVREVFISANDLDNIKQSLGLPE